MMHGRYGLLGERLSHSYSPLLHSWMGNYVYRLYEKKPQELEEFLHSGCFDGLNVTIPYKKAVIPYCTELSEAATRIGSVNTILCKAGGILYGDNTDYYGFSYLAGLLDLDFQGKKALILGSGGASLTVRAVLEDLGAHPVVTISRSGPDHYGNLEKHQDAEILVNTTPVGMYPEVDAAPLSLSHFPHCKGVLDLIYNPAKTRLILDAEARGIPAIGGLPMLVAQAKRACELFTNQSIPNYRVEEWLTALERETKNIVLIGMPGSGKSSVGLLLAKATGRVFMDTDTMVAAEAGVSIPDLFASRGEAAFRQMETRALANAAKGSGRIIAVGGGIVTVPENLDLLRQNSIVVFLDRDPAGLPTNGRPLSQARGTQALYQERYPLYTAWCDLRIAEPKSAEAAAEEIIQALNLATSKKKEV